MEKQMNKIILAFFLFFIAINSYGSEDDAGLSKIYLEKAYNYYNLKQFDITKEYLDKSSSYNKKLPEYYYISGLILDNTKENKYEKGLIADKIIENIDNNFLLKKYKLLLFAALTYRSIREFEKSLNVYTKLFDIEDEDLRKDYIDCIDMLFYSKITGKIPELLLKTSKLFEDITLDYYRLLYAVLYTKIGEVDFNKTLSRLIASNYDPAKILYLKSLFYNNLSKLFNEYTLLKENTEVKWLRKIGANFLKKSGNLSVKQVSSLLNDWIKFDGLRDYYTNIILNDKRLFKIINDDKNLKSSFLKYTGERVENKDEDNDFEKIEGYKDGILVYEIIDASQDGVNDYRIEYLNNRKMKKLTVYKTSSNYLIYNFNVIDGSIIDIENYADKKLHDKTYLIKSSYFPTLNELLGINNKVSEYIDYIEFKDNGFRMVKYDDKKVNYEFIDYNSNNYFEHRIFYKDNTVDYAIKDLDENNLFEIKEVYKKGKLTTIMLKTSDIIKEYNYIENIYDKSVEKLWDNDFDGLFEVKYRDENNGRAETFFDINYDGVYDFMIESKDNKKIGLFELKKGGRLLIRKYAEVKLEKLKKFVIVSVKDQDSLTLPDEVVVNDYVRLSGVYRYKENRALFENGRITGNLFDFKIFYVNDFLYMVDIKR